MILCPGGVTEVEEGNIEVCPETDQISASG
jgi:hypothetical protein